MNDIFVRLHQLDADIKGLVVPLPDGDYRIYINSIYNHEQQREIYNHEIRHLILGHHQQQDRDLGTIEAEAAARETLLDKIKEADRNGLPLISAILREPGPDAPPEEPLPPPVLAPQPKRPAYGSPEYSRQELARIRLSSLTGLYL